MANYMGDETLTPILKELIKASFAPLRVLETTGHFAQDATGITVYRYRRWIDEREGTEEQKRDWIKLTLFCGVKTKAVAAVEVIDGIANESPYYTPLLREVAEHNRVLKVSADAGFSSVSNLTATVEIGAYPYIPFKNGTTGGSGGLWERLFHRFHLDKAEFTKHYSKQNIAESVFSAIKRVIGEAVLSKTRTAMKNECLCKVLCWNLCRVITYMYELEIDPMFWESQT